MNILNVDEQVTLLKTVVERLEKCGIPYMVAGSVAANSYMPVRATNDIDIVIQMREEDIDAIISAFEPDFYINPREAIQDSLRRHYPFNAIFLETAAKVDLVPIKPDPFAREEFSRRCHVQVQGRRFWFVTPEDYILSKLKTYVMTRSDRQLTDLQNVMETQKDKLDFDYLRQWARQLNLFDELEKLI